MTCFTCIYIPKCKRRVQHVPPTNQTCTERVENIEITQEKSILVKFIDYLRKNGVKS